jgi:TatD DNase family protein
VIDLHCHIDLFPDPVSIIERAEAAGIYVLAVTTTPKSWRHLQCLIGARSRIKAAVGLHPELVASRWMEVEEVCLVARETRYVGEVGIDGSSHLRESVPLQRRVFERILEGCSLLGGRILSIHSRRAASIVLDCLEQYPAAGIPILHWFSGTNNELDRAVRCGAWFSVGSTMLKSAKGMKLLEGMPRSQVLTESDGPFCCEGNDPV